MILEPRYVIGAIAIGIGATLLMDLWNLFLKRAFGIPSLNYCLLGRWLRHMPSGIFRHAEIASRYFGLSTLSCGMGPPSGR